MSPVERRTVLSGNNPALATVLSEVTSIERNILILKAQITNIDCDLARLEQSVIKLVVAMKKEKEDTKPETP